MESALEDGLALEDRASHKQRSHFNSLIVHNSPSKETFQLKCLVLAGRCSRANVIQELPVPIILDHSVWLKGTERALEVGASDKQRSHFTA